MNTERAVPLVLAVCCLFALVNLAGSIDTAVSQSPDDAIDFGYDSLPLPSEQAGELKRAFTSSNADAGQPRSDASGGGGTGAPRQPGEQTDDRQRAGSGAGQTGSATRSSDVGGLSPTGGTGQTAAEDTRTLLDLLVWLLGHVLRAVVVLAVLAVAIVAIRRRERVRLLLRRYLDRLDPRDDGVATAADGGDPPETPANRIERAWHEMLVTTDADPGASATPGECADAIVAAGFDRESVRELTDMYERVRYGDVPTTPERTQRALACLRRLSPRDRGGDA